MRRFTALAGKELRQHGVAGLVLLAGLAAGYLLSLVDALAGAETVSLMQAHARFLVFLTLGALVLGNRLVVREYYHRTQLFVEALPLARWEMVALKYSFGLGLLLAAAGASLAATTALALAREAIDGRFVAIVGVRSAAYVVCVWSFFFAMGFVGRLRIAIYAAVILALSLVDGMTAFEIQRFGPIAVVDANTLPFEREILPLRAVLETLALGAGLTALAFSLALIHEGSVAEALARRMSQREKAVLGTLFVALLFALYFIDERRDKPPYDFAGDEVLASETLPLEVLYLLPELQGDAEVLLGHLEDTFETLVRELGWEHPPAVRVAYGPSLDPGIYDRAELAENDGILVRANFRVTPSWDRDDFSAYLVGLILDEATAGRSQFEPKAWLRDAFALWWSRRGHDDDADNAGDAFDLEQACGDDAVLLGALWTAGREPLTEDALAAWLRYRERHGEDLAAAVALSGLLMLEHSHGRDAVLSLAHEVFARRPAEDARELIYEWRHPMAAVFEQAVSLGWSEFVSRWNAGLERLGDAPACRRALDDLPQGSASIDVNEGDGAVRDIVYGFRFARPLPPGTLVTLLHRRLGAFDDTLERRDLRRVEKLWPDAAREASWRLPGLYGRGSRAFLALEVESGLGFALRLHAERRELR